MKKQLSFMVMIALLNLSLVHAVSAGSRERGKSDLTEKVKEAIARLGTGKDAQITVTLRNKRKIAGFVAEARQDAFTISGLETGIGTSVAYADVKQLKGHNLSTGAKIAIGVGIGVAILLVLVLIGLSNLD